MSVTNCVLAVTNDFSNIKKIKEEGKKHNLQVQYVGSINEAFELLSVKDFDLVAIRADDMEYMPKLPLIREMKLMPIIAFSYNCVNDAEKIEALRMGADVFIATPFALEYIIESGLALIRFFTLLGGKKSLTPGSILTHDHIILSTQARSVFVRGEEITLSKREFDLLYNLMKSPGHIYTYQQLYKRIAGDDESDDEQRVIYNHVYQLRRKLKVDNNIPDYILSVKDVGYKLSLIFD